MCDTPALPAQLSRRGQAWRCFALAVTCALPLPCCGSGSGDEGGPSSSGEAKLERPEPGDTAAARPFLARALQHMQASQNQAALEQIDAALEKDPALFEAHVLRAQLLMEKGQITTDLQGALHSAQMAALLDPEHPGALAAEGLVRFHLSHEDVARDLLLRFLALPPLPGSEATRSSVLEAIGRIELHQGELDAAESHLRESMKGPGARRAGPREGLAKAYFDRGEGEEALRWLDEALRLDGHHLAARYLRFQVLVRLGRKGAAEREKEIHSILRQLVDNTSLEFMLDHAGKAKLWAQLCDLLPGDRRARTSEIRELFMAGDDAAVAERTRAVLEGGLRHPEMLSLAARAEARRGRKEEAEAFVAEVDRCQPPVPESRKRQLTTEVQRLLREHAQESGADGS